VSRRREEECAFCAELLDPEKAIKEQKVDENRVKARTCVGEALSRREHERLMEKVEARS